MYLGHVPVALGIPGCKDESGARARAREDFTDIVIFTRISKDGGRGKNTVRSWLPKESRVTGDQAGEV